MYCPGVIWTAWLTTEPLLLLTGDAVALTCAAAGAESRQAAERKLSLSLAKRAGGVDNGFSDGLAVDYDFLD